MRAESFAMHDAAARPALMPPAATITIVVAVPLIVAIIAAAAAIIPVARAAIRPGAGIFIGVVVVVIGRIMRSVIVINGAIIRPVFCRGL